MTQINSHERLTAPARFAIGKRKLSWKQAAVLQFTISAALWCVIIAIVVML